MKASLLAALAAAAVLLTGCAGKSSGIPVVVDTDMSTDDIVALLYVANHPGIDLKAVTVSGTGLATCPAGARNALQLLAVAGRGDVPVACGRGEPLAGANQFPVEWRARADALFGLELPPAVRKPDANAVDLLAKTFSGTGKKATLLSLAPMTDTAELLRKQPELKSEIGRIVAMGGAVGVPGNIGPGHERAEFNFWVDPVAAHEVFVSGIPLTLVPLDATNDVPTTIFFSEALRRAHYATPSATAAWELFVQNPSIYSGGQYFWDPLAAAALTRPELLRQSDQKLSMSTSPGTDQGRTAAAANGSPIHVATGADRTGFEHELLGALVEGAPFTIHKDTGAATLTFDGRTCTYAGPNAAIAGQVAFDTVNTSGRSFTYLVFDRLSGSVQAPELRGDTPPRSSMTWLGYLASGTKGVACTTATSAHPSVVATVTLSGAR